MSFPCTKCGACCRSVHGTPLDRGDGACVHLGEDNACRVYDERPEVCRVDEARPADVPEWEWHAKNLAACDRLHLLVYGEVRVPLGAMVGVRRKERPR